jgi:hypothetical protein
LRNSTGKMCLHVEYFTKCYKLLLVHKNCSNYFVLLTQNNVVSFDFERDPDQVNKLCIVYLGILSNNFIKLLFLPLTWQNFQLLLEISFYFLKFCDIYCFFAKFYESRLRNFSEISRNIVQISRITKRNFCWEISYRELLYAIV